jgi:SanA protein
MPGGRWGVLDAVVLSRRNTLAALVVLGVAGWAFGANASVLRASRERVVDVDRASPAPVIVVLGAGLRPDGAPSDILEDRLETARSLYVAGRAPRILCSGDHGSRSHDETGAMARWLESRGVPAEAIFLDHAGFDSWNTVVRARRVFGVTRAIFVTQRYHLPRVLWTASRVGIDAQGVAADRRPYPAMPWYETRELASRTKATLDVAIARPPRALGEPVDLTGDGRVTR